MSDADSRTLQARKASDEARSEDVELWSEMQATADEARTAEHIHGCRKMSSSNYSAAGEYTDILGIDACLQVIKA